VGCRTVPRRWRGLSLRGLRRRGAFHSTGRIHVSQRSSNEHRDAVGDVDGDGDGDGDGDAGGMCNFTGVRSKASRSGMAVGSCRASRTL
jgi:hypothetical protein